MEACIEWLVLTYIDIQEPQGSQLECMADGSDNPVETISDEDLLDEGRVALELGVGNTQGLDGDMLQDSLGCINTISDIFTLYSGYMR